MAVEVVHQVSDVSAGNFRKPPPLDGTQQITHLYDWHLQSPHFPFFRFPQTDKDGVERIVDWSYEKVFTGVHAFARTVAKHLGTDLNKGQVGPFRERGTDARLSAPIVAIFANGPSMTYMPLLLAIMRAGAVPFPISINNSKEALLNLLRRSGASLLVTNPKEGGQLYDDVLAASLAELEERLDLIPYPSFDEFFYPPKEKGQDILIKKPLPLQPWQSTCYIMHSSGSTSFPKPIYHSQHYVVNLTREWGGWESEEKPWCGQPTFIGHLPPWHTMSFLFPVAFWVNTGFSLQFRTFTSPPKPLAPQDLLAELAASPPNFVMAPPAFWHMWSYDAEALAILRRIPRRAAGGGPIARETLLRLQEAGARVVNALGSTEAALLCRPNFECATMPFDRIDCFETTTKCPIHFRPQNDGSGLFEMLIGCNENFRPNVINDIYEGKEVYATSDLVQVFDGGKYFRVVGRADDQIMHSTGEKTNPQPLISLIQENANVRSCLFFGRGHPFAGLLIEPVDEKDFDPTTDEALAAFRNRVWPDVQRANSIAPTHSTVFKEMILVAKKSKPFDRTPKNTLRGGFILAKYQDEIEAAYDAFEDIAQTRVAAPEQWTATSTLEFVKEVIDDTLDSGAVTGNSLDVDLFSIGADSLRATKIRNVLGTSTKKRLDPQFVYTYPTIRALASALHAIMLGGDGAQSGDSDNAAQAMLDKYSQDWPNITANAVTNGHAASNGTSINDKAEVVLVTGTTGGLGACLVSDLVKSSRVAKVYAVNRRGRQDLRTRQIESFVERGLDVQVLDKSGKVQLVEADLEEEQLGLDQSLYEDIRDSVTVIVHNAWRLDFNLSLSSYEGLIRGTRNLIDMALTGKTKLQPRFLFSSSVSAVLGLEDEGKVPEEEFPLASAGEKLGYGMSKMVVEHLLLQSPLQHTTSIRFGQLSGTVINGYWSVTDWLPLLVKSYEVVGALPLGGDNDSIDWIAMDVASQAYADVILSLESADTTILHVVNPSQTRWNDVIGQLATLLKTQTIPYEEWLARLEKASHTHSPEVLPAAKLLHFFSMGKEALLGGKALDTTKCQTISPALRTSKGVDVKQIRAWIDYWKRAGLLL